MAGGPPKALPSTGPHSLRDMPHPLAGSSSEEAVGGDRTPSPDLLMGRSFGDKVGALGRGLGSSFLLGRGGEDGGSRPTQHRAAPTLGRFPGYLLGPWSPGLESVSSADPAGSQSRQARPEGTGFSGRDRPERG